MTRLTRSAAQANTRTALLDAAEVAFAEEGFAGASLDRIAEVAGFTRGAVYSNFADKADLFASVLDRRLQRRAHEIHTAMARAGDPDGFVAALRSPTWREAVPRQEILRWTLLYDEFRLFALRNPDAAQHLARHERLERDFYVMAIQHLLGQLGVQPPVNPRLIAAVIFAIDESLPRQRCIDPDDVPETAFADAVDLLLQAAVALARR